MAMLSDFIVILLVALVNLLPTIDEQLKLYRH